MSSTAVVFDLESDCSFASLDGMTKDQMFQVMQVTVACALVLDADEIEKGASWDDIRAKSTAHTYWRDGPCRPRESVFEDLLCLFDEAVCIVAYNGAAFDFPLLRKHYTNSNAGKKRYFAHRAKLLDPLLRLQSFCDIRFKLDSLLSTNKIPCKTADGLEAIRMWSEGERTELAAYCAYDVEALARLVCIDEIKIDIAGELLTSPNIVHGVKAAVSALKATDA